MVRRYRGNFISGDFATITVMSGLTPGMTMRKVRRYTDAVVTPPSMTIVWPVMKVDESEPR